MTPTSFLLVAVPTASSQMLLAHASGFSYVHNLLYNTISATVTMVAFNRFEANRNAQRTEHQVYAKARRIHELTQALCISYIYGWIAGSISIALLSELFSTRRIAESSVLFVSRSFNREIIAGIGINTVGFIVNTLTLLPFIED